MNRHEGSRITTDSHKKTGSDAGIVTPNPPKKGGGGWVVLFYNMSHNIIIYTYYDIHYAPDPRK